jgi:hypothetical protein
MTQGSILHHTGAINGTSDVTYECIRDHEARTRRKLDAANAKKDAKELKNREMLQTLPARLQEASAKISVRLFEGKT